MWNFENEKKTRTYKIQHYTIGQKKYAARPDVDEIHNTTYVRASFLETVFSFRYQISKRTQSVLANGTTCVGSLTGTASHFSADAIQILCVTTAAYTTLWQPTSIEHLNGTDDSELECGLALINTCRCHYQIPIWIRAWRSFRACNLIVSLWSFSLLNDLHLCYWQLN